MREIWPTLYMFGYKVRVHYINCIDFKLSVKKKSYSLIVFNACTITTFKPALFFDLTTRWPLIPVLH